MLIDRCDISRLFITVCEEIENIVLTIVIGLPRDVECFTPTAEGHNMLPDREVPRSTIRRTESRGTTPFLSTSDTAHRGVKLKDGGNQFELRTENSVEPYLKELEGRPLAVKSPLSSQNGLRSSQELPDVDYGFDPGRPDLDIPDNDDAIGLLLTQPVAKKNFPWDTRSSEYYAHPIPVKISRSLIPLPEILQNSTMNKLYFHHFINHTARTLVVHDCSANPFRHILPSRKYPFCDCLAHY